MNNVLLELKQLYKTEDSLLDVIVQNIQIKFNLVQQNDPQILKVLQMELCLNKIPIDAFAPHIANYPAFEVANFNQNTQSCATCKYPQLFDIIFNCGHSFCYSCVNTKLQEQQKKNPQQNMMCPTCNSTITLKLLDTLNPNFTLHLNSQLKCPYNKNNCPHISSNLILLNKHLNECKYCIIMKNFTIEQLNPNNYQNIQQKTKLSQQDVVQVIQSILNKGQENTQVQQSTKNQVQQSAYFDQSLAESNSLVISANQQQNKSGLIDETQYKKNQKNKKNIKTADQQNVFGQQNIETSNLVHSKYQNNNQIQINRTIKEQKQQNMQNILQKSPESNNVYHQNNYQQQDYDMIQNSEALKKSIIIPLQQKSQNAEQIDKLVVEHHHNNSNYFSQLLLLTQKYINTFDLNEIDLFLSQNIQKSEKYNECFQQLKFEQNLNKLFKSNFEKKQYLDEFQKSMQNTIQQSCSQQYLTKIQELTEINQINCNHNKQLLLYIENLEFQLKQQYNNQNSTKQTTTNQQHKFNVITEQVKQEDSIIQQSRQQINNKIKQTSYKNQQIFNELMKNSQVEEIQKQDQITSDNLQQDTEKQQKNLNQQTDSSQKVMLSKQNYINTNTTSNLHYCQTCNSNYSDEDIIQSNFNNQNPKQFQQQSKAHDQNIHLKQLQQTQQNQRDQIQKFDQKQQQLNPPSTTNQNILQQQQQSRNSKLDDILEQITQKQQNYKKQYISDELCNSKGVIAQNNVNTLKNANLNIQGLNKMSNQKTRQASNNRTLETYYLSTKLTTQSPTYNEPKKQQTQQYTQPQIPFYNMNK